MIKIINFSVVKEHLLLFASTLVTSSQQSMRVSIIKLRLIAKTWRIHQNSKIRISISLLLTKVTWLLDISSSTVTWDSIRFTNISQLVAHIKALLANYCVHHHSAVSGSIVLIRCHNMYHFWKIFMHQVDTLETHKSQLISTSPRRTNSVSLIQWTVTS